MGRLIQAGFAWVGIFCRGSQARFGSGLYAALVSWGLKRYQQVRDLIAVSQILLAELTGIGIGGRVASPPLPHHRTCGSASGGSEELSYPANKRGRPSASK